MLVGDLLEQGQVFMCSPGHSLRLTWCCYHGSITSRLAVPLSDVVVQIQVVLSRLSDGLCLLQRLQFVAKLRVESGLIGHVLHSADLLAGINIGECAAHNTRTIGDLRVGPVNVAIEATGRVRELVRMRWWRRCCGGRCLEQVRDVSHNEGHAKCQLERVDEEVEEEEDRESNYN